MSTGNENDAQKSSPQATRSRRVGKGVVAALLLGVAGSGLWDLFFKPGLSAGGRAVLTVVTLGSSGARNLAYEMAALDPTAIPALTLVLLVWTGPLVMLILGLLRLFLGAFRRRVAARGINPDLPEREKIHLKRKRLKSFDRKVTPLRFAMLILAAFYCFGIATLTNQTVLIYRVFQANLAICAPYMTDQEIKHMRARFAAVRGKADYAAIDAKLREIATA